MQFLALCLLVAPVAYTLAAPDPTTICLPEKSTMRVFGLIRKIQANVSSDFSQNKIAEVTELERRVLDLNTNYSYAIDPTGACTRQRLPVPGIITRCLPPSTVFLGTVFEGFVNKVSLNGWLIPVNQDINVTLLTYTEPGQSDSYFVLRRDDTSWGQRISFVSNPVASIADTSVFNVPAVCPDKPLEVRLNVFKYM
ncbi:uncharacterized protein LOC101848441 [Aplysia californica]|uniref:Uncharacterized protein LOC101848441 n=1 Tax=Aplysia californica TaxID=6500 RepID=A0ABM1VVR4_APLCA|nr:uncharacterized protein LOC101848441 [Aplysia californica]